MAKFEFKAYHAQPSGSGSFSVIFHLTGKPAPFPPRVIDAKTTAEALAAFEVYKQEAGATGQPMALTMNVREGRAPNGFKAATSGHSHYHRVNV